MSVEGNQTKFLFEGGANNIATQIESESVIVVNADVACSIGKSDNKAYAKIYKIANSLASWLLIFKTHYLTIY